MSGKPRGINAARKLRTVRRENRWANKSYKKAHLGTQFKCNPFGGSSHCKGIVLEKMCARQPLASRQAFDVGLFGSWWQSLLWSLLCAPPRA
jgi:ribosomal protein S12